MGSRIERLVEKYWEGKSSLAEEKEIREYFEKNPGLSPEAKFFRGIEKASKQESGRPFKIPNERKLPQWFSAAASLIIGVGIAVAVFMDAQRQREYIVEDPQEAYEITRKALLMVSSGLNKGSGYSQEIKKINKAEEIIKEKEL